MFRGVWLGLRVRICVRLSFGVRPRVRVGIRVRTRQDKRGRGREGDNTRQRKTIQDKARRDKTRQYLKTNSRGLRAFFKLRVRVKVKG